MGAERITGLLWQAGRIAGSGERLNVVECGVSCLNEFYGVREE